MRTKIPILIITLEREFANPSFDKKIVCRIKDKTINERYGSDRTRLHALFIQGEDIRRHSGIFKIVPSEDFGIESIHFQTSTMQRYAIIYGVDDLKMVDGTHHLTRHDRTTIVWNVVDGLLRTKLAGVSYCQSENNTSVIQGGLYFFPGECVKDGKRNELAVGELSNLFDPELDSEVSLDGNPNSHEDGANPPELDSDVSVDDNPNSDEDAANCSGYEVPINDANSQAVSHTPAATKTPPMTMAVSTDDPFIMKYTIPITFVKGHNH